MWPLEGVESWVRSTAFSITASMMGIVRLMFVWVLMFLIFVCAPTSAQQRPLETEDPETVASGQILIEAGVDYARDQEYVVSGLTGHRSSFPRLGVSVGLSSIAELQIDGMSYNRLLITERAVAPLSYMLAFPGERTSSLEDLSIGMKISLLREGERRPAVGFRFSTKLPNAGNETGLGLDTTDFFSAVLVGKTLQSVRIVSNMGIAILGDPTRGDKQNSLVTFGFSMTRAVAFGVEVVGEVAGRVNSRRGFPPPGTESSGFVRVGTRVTMGTFRWDGGVFYGLTPRDARIGATTGITWVFKGFELP